MTPQKAVLGLSIIRGELPEGFSLELFDEDEKIAIELLKGDFDTVSLMEKFGTKTITDIILASRDLTSLDAGMSAVRRQRTRLALKTLSKEIAKECEGQDPNILLDNIASTITTLSKFQKRKVEFISFTQVLSLGYESLMNTKKEEVISFGYEFLDERLTGIFPSELVVIGGESGTGKTTFATNIIYKASQKTKCTVFALEDRLHDYGIKALYFEIGKIRKSKGLKNYPWNVYRRGEKNLEQNFQEECGLAYENIKNENIEFAKVEEQIDIETLEKLIEDRTKNGTKLFLIDHLHYFDLTKEAKISKADYIEKFMVRLKTVQNKTGASILLVVHYKKLNGTKPTMDSFKDSISIVQNASYVISLWRDRENDQQRYTTTFFIPKSRNPNGEGTISVEFNPDTNDYTTDDTWSMAQKIFNPEII